ncbi:hypothetical protein C6P40_000818 [Pichia californica]|uniref:Uncharacterized protein n=1 Tax=Pichia californica TaxID=460514 RepID=A0A9P7BDV1_9ASCO|nr:hypothetical protein C6P40_000818 [[Candida] californica]
MGKKQIRLPKSVLLKRTDNFEQASSSEPQTAEEFYDAAVNYDESGDRWFSSDLSKGIRFYHRAHVNYKQSLKLNPIMLDSLYNLPRLEFDVYNKYIKDDSVILEDLNNCAEALNDNGPGGLFQDISSLCNSFEASIEILQQSGNGNTLGWDFFYNTALCYSEYIEILCSDPSILVDMSPENLLVKATQRCIYMFDKVLNTMEEILVSVKDDGILNYESVASLCIESYRMFSCVYETLYDENLIGIFDSFMGQYLSKVDSVVLGLISNSLSDDILIPLKIAKLNERSSRQLDFDNFSNIWMSEGELNNNNEKRLTEASSIRSYLDKFETVGIKIPTTKKWFILTELNAKYKTIVDTLRTQIDHLTKIQNSENDLLSGQISLLCSIFIERADIDLERSTFEIQEAVNNCEILVNNSKNLLKNALIFSKKSGGIRESSSGKLARSKRQREAAMRLCLIERKSQEDWNKIIGEKYWQTELNALSDIEGYKQFFS